jgi:hypothetical protein
LIRILRTGLVGIAGVAKRTTSGTTRRQFLCESGGLQSRLWMKGEILLGEVAGNRFNCSAIGFVISGTG